MEKAIYISDIKTPYSSLLTPHSDYSRLYFGTEFCEWLIPSAKQVGAAMQAAKQASLAFTLVTPYVSDAGLDRLKKLFEEAAMDAHTEVIVNDFGTLRLLNRQFPDLKPVLGRLLTRQKRGFGISSKTAGTTPELIKHFQSSNVDSPTVAGFLNQKGVHRVELDNLVQGINLDLSGLDMVASLYVPYGYVTTTRFCPSSYDGMSWGSFKGMCKQECRGQVVTYESDIMKVPVYMRGNTQFFKNNKLPDNEEMEASGIDRIVYEQEIPV